MYSRARLHEWISLLGANDALAERYYHAASLMRSSVRDLVSKALYPLSLLPFRLDVELEAEVKGKQESVFAQLRGRVASAINMARVSDDAR